MSRKIVVNAAEMSVEYAGCGSHALKVMLELDDDDDENLINVRQVADLKRELVEIRHAHNRFVESLSALVSEEDVAEYSNPEAASEMILIDVFTAYKERI